MNINNFKTIEKIVNPYKIYNLYYFRPVKGFSLDSRSIKKGEAFIALAGKYKDGHHYAAEAAKKGASLIVAERKIETNPKIPQFIVENSYQALGELILFARKQINKAKIFGITGSLGKTTTKEILAFSLEPYGKVLKSKGTENNILGVAKTIFSYQGHDFIIFELGANHKGEIAVLADLTKPDIGIITCVKPAHLEGFGTLGRVGREKLSLLKNSRTKAVLNAKDSFLFKSILPNKVCWFRRGKAKGRKNNLYCFLEKRKKNKVYFKVLGKYSLILPSHLEHFIDNYLAALLGGHLLGLPYQELVERLNSFRGVPSMRMEQSRVGNYLILNDAYNANPDSFKKSLKALKNFKMPKVVVAADMLELGSKSNYYHCQLARQILESGCNYCLTYGSHTQAVNRQLRSSNYRNAFHFSSHQKIAQFIKRKMNNKECLVLLKGSRAMELEKVLKFL